MSYEIQPLAITGVQWPILIEMCQKHLGYSPTRGLDEEGFDIKDPSSYLASLDFNNTPTKHLRERSGAFRHFHISFIAVLDDQMITDLASETSLRICAKRGKRKLLAILTGSMDEWYNSILHCCSESSDTEIRTLFNNVLDCFDRIGARHIFSSLHRQELSDGTLKIWCRS